MTRQGSTEVVRLSREDWFAIIGIILTCLLAVFGGIGVAWRALDARMTTIEASDRAQNLRINSNEKEVEFAAEKFSEIKEAIKDIGDNIQELRKDLNTL